MIHRISTRLFFNFKSYVDQSECIYASYNVRDIFITKNEYSNDSLLILSVDWNFSVMQSAIYLDGVRGLIVRTYLNSFIE